MKLCIFRTVRLSIISCLFTVHSAMVYVIQVCRQLSSRTRMELQFHPSPARRLSTKPVWHLPLLSVQWINSWWWTDELSETCRVSWQNKFVKLVHIVGFVTKKLPRCLHDSALVQIFNASWKRQPVRDSSSLRHSWEGISMSESQPYSKRGPGDRLAPDWNPSGGKRFSPLHTRPGRSSDPHSLL